VWASFLVINRMLVNYVTSTANYFLGFEKNMRKGKFSEEVYLIFI
jgi:hypothetical protein